VYLVCIWCVSGVYLVCIWCVSGVYLVCIWCVSVVYLVCIWCVSGVYLVCIWCVSGVCIWCVSGVYLVFIWRVSGVYLVHANRRAHEQNHGYACAYVHNMYIDTTLGHLRGEVSTGCISEYVCAYVHRFCRFMDMRGHIYIHVGRHHIGTPARWGVPMVSIWIWACICTDILQIHGYACAYVHICMCIYLHTKKWGTNIYSLYIYVCVCIYMYIYVWVCIYTPIQGGEDS